MSRYMYMWMTTDHYYSLYTEFAHSALWCICGEMLLCTITIASWGEKGGGGRERALTSVNFRLDNREISHQQEIADNVIEYQGTRSGLLCH